MQTLTTQDTFRKPFPATYCAFILSSNLQCFSKCMVRVGIAPHCSSNLESGKNRPRSENGITSWFTGGEEEGIRVNHGLGVYQYSHPQYNSTSLCIKTLCAVFYKNTVITNKRNIFLVRLFYSLPRKTNRHIFKLEKGSAYLNLSQPKPPLGNGHVLSLWLLRPYVRKGNAGGNLG